MAIKELKKAQNKSIVVQEDKKKEKMVESFISQGGTLTDMPKDQESSDHRLTLRIPKWLMDRVDEKRRERIGKISRNLWILEIIEKASKK